MKVLKNSMWMYISIVSLPCVLLAQTSDSLLFDQPDPFQESTVRIMPQLYALRPADATEAPEAITRRFLTENAHVFQIRPGLDDLVIERIQEPPGGKHVRLYQTYRGIPVFRSRTVISMNSSNRITSYSSDHRPDIILPSVTPAISREDAMDLSKAALSTEGPFYGNTPQATLMVLPLVSGYSLGYRVLILCSNPDGYWEVFINAFDGSIIWIHDMTVHFDGSGKVFEPDPLTTAQHYYGSDGFEDNNDQDHVALNNQRITVTLKDIEKDGPTYRLNGPYVSIVDEPLFPPLIPPATSNDGNFNYSRSQDGFEDVMVYYHVDKSQRYLQSIGFADIQNNAIEADAHGVYGGEYGSGYVPPPVNKMFFDIRDVDDAEDADVIWHEYGHAIQHGQISGSFSGEMIAVTEGFGDYWAGSYSASISSWQSDFVFTWDAGLSSSGNGQLWLGRRLDESFTYDDYSWLILLDAEAHKAGMIWSASLWDIFNSLGRAITDKLVIKSHYYLNSSDKMEVAAANVVIADEDLYNGAHWQTIVDIFYARAFNEIYNYIRPESPKGLTLSGSAGQNPVLNWNENPEPDVMQYWVYRKRIGLDGDYVKIATVPHGTTTYTDYAITITPAGNYVYYRLKAYDESALASYFSSTVQTKYPLPGQGSRLSTGDRIPDQFSLRSNHPNPFNPITNIKYDLPDYSFVQLSIFDVMGRKVRTLVNGNTYAGYRNTVWDGTDNFGNAVAAGVYLYHIQAQSLESENGISQTRKMVLLR